MKTKKVNRYYCDYCGKGGGSAFHMVRHEKKCTMNPQRECGMCAAMCSALGESALASPTELIAMLPTVENYRREDKYGVSYSGLVDALKAVLPKVREAAGNCPACILAALRQSGIPMGCVDKDVFDFGAEIESLWNKINERRDNW